MAPVSSAFVEAYWGCALQSFNVCCRLIRFGIPRKRWQSDRMNRRGMCPSSCLNGQRSNITCLWARARDICGLLCNSFWLMSNMIYKRVNVDHPFLNPILLADRSKIHEFEGVTYIAHSKQWPWKPKGPVIVNSLVLYERILELVVDLKSQTSPSIIIWSTCKFNETRTRFRR